MDGAESDVLFVTVRVSVGSRSPPGAQSRKMQCGQEGLRCRCKGYGPMDEGLETVTAATVFKTRTAQEAGIRKLLLLPLHLLGPESPQSGLNIGRTEQQNPPRPP